MNQLFRALNDPTRREILKLLKNGDLTAGEIAMRFDISKPSISHHLDILFRAHLVSKERDGQYIRYSLNTTALESAANWMFDLINKEKE